MIHTFNSRSIKAGALAAAAIVFTLFFAAHDPATALNSKQFVDIQSTVGLSVGTTAGGVDRPVLLLVAKTVQFLLGFVGIVFFLYVLYAGFLWMTAAGNEEASSKSMKMIFQSVIGLAIILFSYAITTQVINLFFEVQYNSLSPTPPI